MGQYDEVLKKIKLVDTLEKRKYIDEPSEKVGIVLHHTASGPSVSGIIDYWNSQPKPVSTPFIIARDGSITQLFSSNRKCYHLGVATRHVPKGIKSLSPEDLNFKTVGLELVSWGGLTKTDKGWKSYAGAIIPASEVAELDFRGYKGYQEYTDAQLESTKKLVQFLGDKYDIPVEFKGMDIFNYQNHDAFKGVRGVYTHCSYRPKGDKQDVAPTPKMIKMLESL